MSVEYFSILVQFEELQAVSLYFLDCFDVLVEFWFAVFDEFVSENEVDETVAELYFCGDEL